jgi:hypothetical protein
MPKGIKGFQSGHKIWLGKHHSKKSIGNIIKTQKGRHYSKKTEFKNGHKPTFQLFGEKNPNWQGGKSFEPYSVDWTNTLKNSIRQRDKYTCCLCGHEPSICVHHINYNKLNCNPNNLITLCRKCHSKTNNKRSFWIEFFTKRY